MAKIEILIPGDIIVKAYKQGLEDMFMLMQDFDDLETELNCNNIDTESDDDV